MADSKYVSKDNLTKYNDLVEETYQKKEKKTGSDTEYKGLSDNNLTDELLEKIKNAGDSSFTGSYDDLTDIPTLDGKEIKGALTSEDLGLVTSDDMEQAISDALEDIETKISSVYTPMGSTTFNELPNMTADTVGHVYNISEPFVTTTNFVEGASKSYPAGTNVVCVEESTGVYKWDVLAGWLDTSAFALKDEMPEPMSDQEVEALFQ